MKQKKLTRAEKIAKGLPKPPVTKYAEKTGKGVVSHK